LKADAPAVEFARCFLRLANYPISRSIASVAMKQAFGAKPVGRSYALEKLDRCKPQERTRRV